MRIHCLGGGLVGAFVTRKLVQEGFDVHLFDVVERHTPAQFHLQSALEADHAPADIVVNMVPGSIGHEVLISLANNNHRIVDLSFSETTPDALVENNSTILWDVGVAPGLSNMLVALASRRYGQLDSVTIKVGGNPAQPDGEWSYMAPFSPHDVIAEYTRPARIVKEGNETVVPAMSELHTIKALFLRLFDVTTYFAAVVSFTANINYHKVFWHTNWNNCLPSFFGIRVG